MAKRIREFQFRGRSSIFSDGPKDYGWVPVGASEAFQAGGPTIVAHDVLEHLAYNEDFKGELLAFGTTLFGRVIGRMAEDGRASRIQMDASGRDLAQFLAQQKYVVPDPHPFAQKLQIGAMAETALSVVMHEAERETQKPQAVCGDPTCTACTTQAAYISPEQFEAQREKVLTWIRLGYKMAERFYGKPERLYRLFVTLAEAVGNDHDERRPKNGEKLRVEVDTNRMAIHLTTKAGISHYWAGDQHA